MLSRIADWLLRWLEPACWFKNPAWVPLPTPAVTPVEPEPASGSGGDPLILPAYAKGFTAGTQSSPKAAA